MGDKKVEFNGKQIDYENLSNIAKVDVVKLLQLFEEISKEGRRIGIPVMYLAGTTTGCLFNCTYEPQKDDDEQTKLRILLGGVKSNLEETFNLKVQINHINDQEE